MLDLTGQETVVNLGDVISVSGCVTKEKFIAGRTLVEIEKILGYQHGRFANGIVVVALQELPALHQFDLAAYSNVATHRLKAPPGLNIEKLKADARAGWTVSGFERLVKVLPTTRHNPNIEPDFQYPPGQGAPQWVAKAPLKGKVVGVITEYPTGVYVAADAAPRR